jgi:hypothetical protein
MELKEKIERKLDELNFTAIRSKNYVALVQNPAWQEMTEQWCELIRLHDAEKMSLSYNTFLQSKLQDPNKAGGTITGIELLQQKAAEEIQLDVYRRILLTIDTIIKVGHDAESKLLSFKEGKK